METNPKKEFEKSAAAYILGENKSFKIKGNKEQVKAFSEVLKSSKKLFETLQNETSTNEKIVEALKLQDINASNFEKVFGFFWPF
jgi:hypothetical protein